jgi:hypothetical protein
MKKPYLIRMYERRITKGIVWANSAEEAEEISYELPLETFKSDKDLDDISDLTDEEYHSILIHVPEFNKEPCI